MNPTRTEARRQTSCYERVTKGERPAATDGSTRSGSGLAATQSHAAMSETTPERPLRDYATEVCERTGIRVVGIPRAPGDPLQSVHERAALPPSASPFYSVSMRRDRDGSRFFATPSRQLRYDGRIALIPSAGHLILTIGIPARFPRRLLAVSPGIWLAQLRPRHRSWRAGS